MKEYLIIIDDPIKQNRLVTSKDRASKYFTSTLNKRLSNKNICSIILNNKFKK